MSGIFCENEVETTQAVKSAWVVFCINEGKTNRLQQPEIIFVSRLALMIVVHHSLHHHVIYGLRWKIVFGMKKKKRPK